MNGTEEPAIDVQRPYSPFDRALENTRGRLFGRSRTLTVAVSIVVYAVAVLALAPALGVSTNYFVILPVICASMGYGLRAGFAAGTLGLPANLLLFAALGHPDYGPASKPIAELSGIVVGTVLGYLSDYHNKVEAERALLRQTEGELRTALGDREALFRELHHRVKNNLNLIKSIVGLQARRSSDAAFKDAAAILTGRIMSISFVHERLYRTAELSTLQLDEYLADLVAAIAMAVGRGQVVPRIKLDLQSLVTNLDVAVPLGLIVNELATNAFKHGKPDGGSVSFELSMRADGERIELAARDDGVGIPGMTEEGSLRIEEAALSCPGRLGFTLLALMSAQLGGEGAYRRKAGWTEYLLEFGTGDKA